MRRTAKRSGEALVTNGETVPDDDRTTVRDGVGMDVVSRERESVH